MPRYGRKYEEFIAEHSEVEEWLRNRPENTKRKFASCLKRFCEAIELKPIEWRNLDKFEARDLAWKYVQPFIKDHSGTAQDMLTALKSWYRNKNGEKLPFDSGKGGKHYLHIKHPKRALEHIPNKRETYQIIDMAGSLRDKSLLLLLFQSGVRVNVIEHLTYGHVKDQLDKDIITLKITGDLDHKLRSRDIPFYYTFLNGEASETLKRYCEVKHENSSPETPLFPTKYGKPINQRYIWIIVKNCVRKAGFDAKAIWTHTIRKAFRKIVRQTPIDDDDKEQLMGHVIPGSREAYYDEKDVELIREAYQKCNFTREIPESNHVKMKNELEQLRSLPGMVEELKRELAAMKGELNALKKA